MSRVTSKLRVTIPKAIARRYRIEPGADITWLPAGEAIRVVPPISRSTPDPTRRLELFDRATERQRLRQGAQMGSTPTGRGWRREDLHTRGLAD